MKITDMIVSGLIKRGVLYEAKNLDVEFDIPRTEEESKENKSERIKIHLTCEHMTLKVDKEEA